MYPVKFEIDGKEILFLNDSRSTRHGFAHDSEMFVNGCAYGKRSCYYLNRTWEWYSHQTSMLECAYAAMNWIKERTIQELKDANGWKKLTQIRKNEAGKTVNENPDYIFFGKVAAHLKNNLCY